MAKLRLGPIADEKPVKLTVQLPAAIHRNLVAYGRALAEEAGQPTIEPGKLIAPMLERFMNNDRAFTKMNRATPPLQKPP